MDETKWWETLRWWWLTYLWYPLRRRCAWCGYPMLDDERDPRIGETHFVRDLPLGLGRYACDGCTAYPEG